MFVPNLGLQAHRAAESSERRATVAAQAHDEFQLWLRDKVPI